MKYRQLQKSDLIKGQKRGKHLSYVYRLNYGYNVGRVLIFPRGFSSHMRTYFVREFPKYVFVYPKREGLMLLYVEDAYIDDALVLTGFVDHDRYCSRGVVAFPSWRNTVVCHNSETQVIWDPALRRFSEVSYIDDFDYRKLDDIKRQFLNIRRLLYESGYLKSFRRQLERIISTYPVSDSLRASLYNLLEREDFMEFAPTRLREVEEYLRTHVQEQELCLENEIQRILED